MPRPLDRRSPSAVKVWWEHPARAAMIHEAHAALPHETGGLLLGFSSETDIVIIHSVGPGPDAEHRPTSFTPDRDWQYAQIDTLYEESGQTLQYLGDWHTHPGGTSQPSDLDIDLLHDIATTPESRCPRPIMGILTHDDDGRWAATFHHLYQPQNQRRVPRLRR